MPYWQSGQTPRRPMHQSSTMEARRREQEVAHTRTRQWYLLFSFGHGINLWHKSQYLTLRRQLDLYTQSPLLVQPWSAILTKRI
jgi:hypothetical protein